MWKIRFYLNSNFHKKSHPPHFKVGFVACKGDHNILIFVVVGFEIHMRGKSEIHICLYYAIILHLSNVKFVNSKHSTSSLKTFISWTVLCPRIKWLGNIDFVLSVVNFNLLPNFWTILEFHIWHAYSTYKGFSIDAKVSVFMIVIVTFTLRLHVHVFLTWLHF